MAEVSALAENKIKTWKVFDPGRKLKTNNGKGFSPGRKSKSRMAGVWVLAEIKKY